MDPRTLLRDRGLRLTPARESVLGALHRCGRPLTHAALAELPELSSRDRVTVYRTLSALVEAGLAHRVQGIDGAWRYCAHLPDATGCPGGHPHFQCERCGQMSCLTDQELPWVEVPEGARVDGKQLVVWGVCPACAS